MKTNRSTKQRQAKKAAELKEKAAANEELK